MLSESPLLNPRPILLLLLRLLVPCLCRLQQEGQEQEQLGRKVVEEEGEEEGEEGCRLLAPRRSVSTLTTNCPRLPRAILLLLLLPVLPPQEHQWTAVLPPPLPLLLLLLQLLLPPHLPLPVV